MENLAYLHLALAYEASKSSEAEIKIQQPEQIKTKHKASKANSKLLLILETQLISKLVPSIKLNFLARIKPIVLALAFMCSSPISALTVRGSSGKDVVYLQNNLKLLGYFPKNARETGYFGKTTETSVRNFQRDNNLVVDGKVGSNTWKSLKKARYGYHNKQKRGNVYRNPILSLGSTGATVAQLKQYLNNVGYSAGNGTVFDKKTEEAVKRFQQSKSLKVDGIVGAQTYMALWVMAQDNIAQDNSNPESASVYYYRGQLYSSRGKEYDAIENYLEYLKLTKDITAATKWRVTILEGKFNYPLSSPLEYCSEYRQTVISDYIKVLKDSPKDAEAYTKRGKLLLLLGDYKLANNDFREAIKQKKDYAPAYYYLALSLAYDFGTINGYVDEKKRLEQEKTILNYFDEAIKFYEDTYSKIGNSQIDPKAIQIRRELANAYFDRANYRIETVRKLEIDSLNFVDIAFLKRNQMNFREKEKTIKKTKKVIMENESDLKKAIDLKTDYLAQAYYLRAYPELTRFYLERKYDKDNLLRSSLNPQAIKYITQAIRINPYFYLEYPENGFPHPCPAFDAQEFLKKETQTIRKNPNDADAYYNRGVLYLQLGNEEEAIKDFNRVIDELKRGNEDTYYNRGLAYYRQRKYKEAIDNFDKAIKIRAKNADLYLIRALAHYDNQDLKRAGDDCKKAIKLNRESDKNQEKESPNTDPEQVKDYKNANAHFILGLIDYASAGNNRQKMLEAQNYYLKAFPDMDGNQIGNLTIWPLPLPTQGSGGVTQASRPVGALRTRNKADATKRPQPNNKCRC